MKPNIKGKITEENLNYRPEDIGSIEPLNPEEGVGKTFVGVKQNRNRYKNVSEIPDRLPTADLMPYPIDEHEFIGQFETKKNLYLLLAHAYNKAMERIEALENRV